MLYKEAGLWVQTGSTTSSSLPSCLIFKKAWLKTLFKEDGLRDVQSLLSSLSPLKSTPGSTEWGSWPQDVAYRTRVAAPPSAHGDGLHDKGPWRITHFRLSGDCGPPCQGSWLRRLSENDLRLEMIPHHLNDTKVFISWILGLMVLSTPHSVLAVVALGQVWGPSVLRILTLMWLPLIFPICIFYFTISELQILYLWKSNRPTLRV